MTLTLRAVTYRYAGMKQPALSEISLEVAPGSVTGVVGANEAGKSTLCLLAAGLAPATIGGHVDGLVQINGLSTGETRPSELAQLCGILFQNAETQLSGTAATVWEEVAFGPRNLSLPLSEVVDRTEGALATLGIDALAPREPSRLSGGQAQLVALAAVLAMRPAYLVLDEPTSQLDPQGTQLVGDALQRLARDTGVGLLVVEHKTDLLASIAGRCIALAAGRIVAEGPCAAVLGDAHLEDWGVEAPAAVRIARAARAGGLKEPLLSAVMTQP
ncbi:MAG: energy-coupling factor ABC transporter ATP-binding protein [Chloroflexota bacterium]|nr:energy-coupling factor ABC transporter ATP-binding protein [Chloroflexota bacterium]